MAGYKRKRNSDAWQLIVTVGSDYTGKAQRYTKTVHCENEREADRELALFFTDCVQGKSNKSNPTTISHLCQLYIDEYAQRYLKKSSVKSSRSAIDAWIEPKLGKLKINKLKRIEVQLFVNEMSDNGKSPKTVRNVYSVLQSMMNYAIELGLIESSPCQNIRMPRRENKEAKYYSKDEMKVMIEALNQLSQDDLRFKCAIMLALFTGARRGEIMGLNWDDVNLDTGEAYIHRTRMVVKGGLVEDTPKTVKSNRHITIPSFVLHDLKSLKKQQIERRLLIGSEYKVTEALLQGERGNPMYPPVLTKWFNRFCRKNGLPEYGMHALRHTHASLLANMNIDKMQISQRLGHSQLSTTMNIYTHLFDDADKQISNNLEKFVDKIVDKIN